MIRLPSRFLPVLCLAAAAPAQLLVACDSSRGLFTIDPATGAKTRFGSIISNAATTGGYDRATGTVYLSPTSLDSPYTLDLATGNATLLGPYGDTAIVMHGLEWDSANNRLYGVSSHNNGLYALDTTNQSWVIGTRIGFQGVDVNGTGGCPSPQLTLTDPLLVTFG